MNDIVMVPVPRQHLEAVYGFLAGRTSSEGPTSPPEQGVEVEGQYSWTREMLLKLKTNLHLQDARTLLDAVAAASPEEVSMRDVAADNEIDPLKLRAQMGALTKLAKKLFSEPIWPVAVRYGDEAGTETKPGATGLAYYRMPMEVAEWWKSI